MPGEVTLTVSRAARLADVNPIYIYRLLAQGRLSGQKDPDGRWILDGPAFDEWRKQHVRRLRKAVAVSV